MLVINHMHSRNMFGFLSSFQKLLKLACLALTFMMGGVHLEAKAFTLTLVSVENRAESVHNLETTRPISLAECNAETKLTFRFNNFTTTTQKVISVFQGTDCQTGTNRTGMNPTCFARTIAADTSNIVDNGTLIISAKELFPTCEQTQNRTDTFFFLVLPAANSADNSTEFQSIKITLDPVAPAAASDLAGGAGDSTVSLAWTAPSGAATSLYGTHVFVDTAGCAGGTPSSLLLIPGSAPTLAPIRFVTGTAATLSLNPSELGLGYGDAAAVAISFVDSARNESLLSNLTCIERVQTTGYWDAFCQANPDNKSCTTSGGCSLARANTSTGQASWLFILGAFLAFRGKRWRGTNARRPSKDIATSFLIAGMLLLPSADAAADEPIIYQGTEERFTLELRGGPLQLNESVFKSTFGADQGPLLGFEMDAHLFRIPKVALIGIGMQLGFAEWDAKADVVSQDSGEKTGFSLVPITGLLSLRLDVLARTLHVPLVLVGKLGATVGHWETGKGSVKQADGWSWSLFWGAQLALEMDFLEPGSAKRLDSDWGINHFFLFGEIFGYEDVFSASYPVDAFTFALGAGVVF